MILQCLSLAFAFLIVIPEGNLRSARNGTRAQATRTTLKGLIAAVFPNPQITKTKAI